MIDNYIRHNSENKRTRSDDLEKKPHNTNDEKLKLPHCVINRNQITKQ